MHVISPKNPTSIYMHMCLFLCTPSLQYSLRPKASSTSFIFALLFLLMSYKVARQPLCADADVFSQLCLRLTRVTNRCIEYPHLRPLRSFF